MKHHDQKLAEEIGLFCSFSREKGWRGSSWCTETTKWNYRTARPRLLIFIHSSSKTKSVGRARLGEQAYNYGYGAGRTSSVTGRSREAIPCRPMNETDIWCRHKVCLGRLIEEWCWAEWCLLATTGVVALVLWFLMFVGPVIILAEETLLLEESGFRSFSWGIWHVRWKYRVLDVDELEMSWSWGEWTFWSYDRTVTMYIQININHTRSK